MRSLLKKQFFVLSLLCIAKLNFSQTYNMSSGTVNTCSGTFYDSGGSGSNYGNNQNFTQTFCSNAAGKKISFNFTSFNVENCSGGCDFLYVYDGPTTSSPLIGQFYDNLTGVTTPTIPIPITSTGTCITFRFTSDGSSTQTGWVATISCVTSLPIDLLYFSATQKNQYQVKINWETASENNNDYFIIYKSNNAVDWQKLTQVKGAGTSTQNNKYEFIDVNPYQGISYYQLKQTDFNGESKLSDIKKVNNAVSVTPSIEIFPNPASHVLNINTKLLNEKASIEITNILGQVVFTEIFSNQNSSFNIQHLSNGIYSVKVITKNNQTTKRLVISK
jgi:Secretion system C-terminal sorting domain/CUB domain